MRRDIRSVKSSLTRAEQFLESERELEKIKREIPILQ